MGRNSDEDGKGEKKLVVLSQRVSGKHCEEGKGEEKC